MGGRNYVQRKRRNNQCRLGLSWDVDLRGTWTSPRVNANEDVVVTVWGREVVGIEPPGGLDGQQQEYDGREWGSISYELGVEGSAGVGHRGSRTINFAHPDGSGRNEASEHGLVQYEERQDE